MPKILDKDLELIDEAMNSFMQAMSRPRTWDRLANQAGVNLDRAGATLLHFLEHSEQAGCHLSELANRLGIEAPSVTRKVQQLERQRLVQRVPDPRDGRAQVLKITHEGREIINRFRKAKRDLFAAIITDWPAADRHTFAALLYRLSQDLGSYRERNSNPTLNVKRSL